MLPLITDSGMAHTLQKQKELAPQRLDRLRGILHENHVVRVDELCMQLSVSPATVRRDLEELERLGEVRRIHGGAVLEGQRAEEPLFDDKASIARREKFRIAEFAASLIEARDTIYLDGGSTVLELTRLIRERSNITVVTNSLRAAWELAGGGPKLILIGGELRRLSQTMVGALTRHLLCELNIDKAFMGTLGLTLAEGLTTTDPAEAFTKELVMKRAHEVIVLAHSGKVGNISFVNAGKLQDVDVLVTDREMEDGFAREVERQGITLYRV
jgi:DeoR family transcriptional regulator, fructose operon transcriptional repressor